MMKRRIISILLSCCMMLTLLPTAVFAEDGGAEAAQCVCETACAAEQMNTECPVCGAADAAPQRCGKYISPKGGDTDPVDGAEGSENPSEQRGAEKVQALIDALPGADSIRAENAEDAAAQLAAIDTAKAALSDEEQAALDMTRYEAASAALAALESTSMTLYVVLPDTTILTLEDVKAEDTIGSIKTKIQSEKGYAVTLQKLFATLDEDKTELQDDHTLSDYAIQSGSTLTLELLAEKPDGTYDLAEGSIEITVDETGAQTVKQGENTTAPTGAVTIIQSGSDTPTTEYSITVTAAAGQTAHIVLAGVNINLNATGNVASSSASSSNIYSFGTAAMATYGEGNVTLELDGTNALISGQFRAGLEKHNAGMLTINDKNKVPGSLKAWGSYGGAGIGGIGCFYYFQDSHSDKFDQPYPGKMDDASVENITINGGTIEAESYANIRSYIESGGSRGDTRGGSGAGIGGGRGGTAKNITINGGTITTTAGSGAGIGGGSGGSLSRTSYIFYFGHAENITINGGTIHATSTSGAGIGGGYGISTASGDNFPKIGDRGNGKNITITGGKVTAISDSYSAYSGGAGIGGGSQGSGIGITITGGEVIAQGGNFSAGIGGGSQGSGIDITINGGTVTATGGGGGAGIGSGGYQKNPDDIIPVGKAIHILGGSVHATGGSRQSTETALNDKGGAGIGGGYGGNGIDIRIENAEVTAIGGKGEASDSYRKDGAGIGGGGLASSNNVAYGGTGENIFISNSTITATGTYGAGIGGGQGGNGVKISIVNGTVMKAKSVSGAGIGGGEDGIGDDITITGSTITATGAYGAGIGGGENGDGKNITITGSEVTAAGGLYGAGIGGGRNGNGESITISSGSRVTAYCGSGSPDGGTSAYGAGIGGGQAYGDEGKGKGNGRQITITDSEVLAFGSGGAGIGGGYVGVSYSASTPLDPELGSGNGEDITIRGSKVTAYSSSGAGIGGGMTRGERYNTSRYSGMGRNITIEDSNVKAFSTCSGAGIGGGKGGDSENITIKSGTVTATGGYQGGAGIGGGGAYYGGNAKGITILGGTVTATGGSYIREGNREGNCYWGGAGIGGGGGEYHGGGDAADITISGGTVTAIGGSNAAGIGGGSGSATDDFNTREEVFAYKNPWNPSVRSGCAENITISGGTVTAIGQFKASGIGGGGFYAIIEDRLTYGEDPRNPIRAAGSAKNITITGGFITAQGGTEGVSIGRSAFSFFELESSEEDLSASGGTFYRSIPNTVELQGHVVQYQVDGTVSAWQVVQDDGLAYLPRLTDENGVSLDEWYRENEKYDFDTPVIAGLTLTAQAHTCDGWRSDENSHWHDCTDCGKILDKAAHVFGDWEAIAYPTKEATGKWKRICTVCGYAETRNLPALDDPKHSCVYDLKIVSPETQKTRGSCVQDKVYYMSCECGAISSTETFTVSGLPAHFMESGILPYNFKRSSFDVTQHWDVCASCHMIWERTKHTGTSDVQCIYCDYRKSPHDHILELIPAKAPTCTENGNIAYYICSGCSGTYKDEAGNEFIQLYGEYNALTKQTITEYGSGAIILATGHSLANDEWQKGENAHWRLCACGAVFDRGLHTYDGDSDTTCNTCGYVRTIAPTTYTVTLPSGTGYTAAAADGSTSPVSSGESFSFTVTISNGFQKGESFAVKANGNPLTEMDGKYTISNITENQIVTVEGVEEIPPTPGTYTVRFDANGGSVHPASMSTGADGKLASLPTPTRSSYSFDGWYTEKSGGTKVTTETVFKKETTVYAHWTYTGGSGGDSSYTYYTLTFETNGGSTISGERFRSGTMVDLTKYTPIYKGYTFTGWYSDKGLTDKITSIKLDGSKTVYAGWRTEQNPQTGANPFTDVSKSDWFYDDVIFVYEKSLMVGTSDTLFSPYGTATRAMMATILWRMEGSPAPKNAPDFTDVASGKWYSDAITWTTENGIYQGYGNGKFGPDDPITREQLAAIFYRYADYKGYDMTVKGSLDKFKDKDKVSTWAQDAMQWAVGSGLIQGKTGSVLDPQGTATRAEIAAMLHRFIEKYGLVEGKAPGGMTGWIDPKRLKIPQTGDASTLGLWSFTLCASLAGCLALTTAQLRRKREEEALQIIEK